jgi:spermidine/putrescine transport system ATP-binding protein
VYENPATEFVAGFLGASNLLEGDVKETTDGTSTVALDAGGMLRLPSARIPSDAGSHLKVGVRPEKIAIRRGDIEPESDQNAIVGTVTMSTYIGVNHQYKVKTPGTVMTVYVQNLKAEDDPRQGEQVTLTWALEHTFAVAPQEGLALEEEEE